MIETSQTLDRNMERKKLLERKLAELVDEASAEGFDPFLCVIIMQTYNSLTVRSAADVGVLPDREGLDVLLAKIQALVVEHVAKSPNLETIPGIGAS